MGIKGLTGLIQDECPGVIKQTEMKALFGRKIAIDASMSLYQFLIAVRQQDGQQLMNESGETTSHLMGMWYRTLRMVENDIKPLYVFDGKPPELKTNVLKKRFVAREEAKEGEEEAKEVGTTEDVDKMSRRQVKVTRQHNEDVKKLLKLMGIPYIDAPSEAEAQCAELARGGVVYAAGTEDMDTLTFNTPTMLRHLTFSEARKMSIDVITLADVLKGLDLTMDKFIDFCMLCGCDYLEPIKGIGAKTALKLVKEYDDMEEILEFLRTPKPKAKNQQFPPEHWPYKEAKELFVNPNVTPASECEVAWTAPDLEGLIQFLVHDNGFAEDRVRKGTEKLSMHLKAKQQGRLDGFFKVLPKSDAVAPGKRKADDKGKGKDSKKAKKDTKKASTSKK